MLTKIEHIKHEILEDGTIFIITTTEILEDGVSLGASKIHRNPLTPGANTRGRDQRTKDLAATVHTSAVISAYRAKVVAR